MNDSLSPQDTQNTEPRVTILSCSRHKPLAEAMLPLHPALLSFLPRTLPRKVLIKPNLCDIVSWESGVTTDPAWLGVLADALRAIRPDVEILCIESDAVSAYKNFRSCDETFARLGYVEAARDAGVQLVNLSSADSLEITLRGIPQPVRLALLLLDEFYFISIANLKVHSYTRMTSVLKNLIGLVGDADISGLHPYLSSFISGLYQLCTPDFSIVDGRIGLEGHGPILGDPVGMDAVIFSNDAFTADVAACALMMISPQEVPYLASIAKEFHREYPNISIPAGIQPHRFAFDAGGNHKSILLKFGNRRLHKSSEIFTNRWIDRFLRFKKDPIAFAREGIPKLVRRTYAR
jgi:uncharacterized protein (DUF362 family)